MAQNKQNLTRNSRKKLPKKFCYKCQAELKYLNTYSTAAGVCRKCAAHLIARAHAYNKEYYQKHFYIMRSLQFIQRTYFKFVRREPGARSSD